jgi:multidrug efflux pump subunit AcrA (membrane-fusion protein)
LRITAPAQIVASFQNQNILFSEPESSELYSEYLQSVANYEKAKKNEIRVQEMYHSQAATARELSDSKTDAINARSIKADLEVRLKAVGLNPRDLKHENSKKVWVLADVPENQLHEVEQGEEVRTTFLSYPGQVFLGRVDSVGDIVDPDTRTVKVRVVLDNSNGRLKAGMFAECDFGSPQVAAIVLPASAVISVEEKDYVFVAQSDTSFKRTPVSVAASNGQQCVIASGLKPGEKVATTGVIFLKGLSFGY